MSRMFLAVVVIAMLAGPVLAEPVAFSFRGTINNLNGVLAAPFQATALNDPFEFNYVFESTKPDTRSEPSIGEYEAITGNFRVKIGSAEASWVARPPNNKIYVYPDNERYVANLQVTSIFVLAVAEFAPDGIVNDSLPRTLPWSLLTNGNFTFATGGTSVNGNITGWTPEPSSLALLALASPLAFRRRR